MQPLKALVNAYRTEVFVIQYKEGDIIDSVDKAI